MIKIVLVALCALCSTAQAAPVLLDEVKPKPTARMLEDARSDATACVIRAVAQDKRRGAHLSALEFNDLIVDAVIYTCITEVRIMMEFHNLRHGEGSGEEYLLSTYLNELPHRVADFVREAEARPRR